MRKRYEVPIPLNKMAMDDLRELDKIMVEEVELAKRQNKFLHKLYQSHYSDLKLE